MPVSAFMYTPKTPCAKQGLYSLKVTTLTKHSLIYFHEIKGSTSTGISPTLSPTNTIPLTSAEENFPDDFNFEFSALSIGELLQNR